MAAKREKLLENVKKCLQNKEYSEVLGLFNADQVENLETLKLITADLLEILLVHLNEDNYKNNLDLYTCCEEIMKLTATHSQAEEVLFELLQIVEENPSENVFTTALKCLQICLLRLKAEKSRALEWTLNSIVNRVTELKLPSYVVSGCSPRQEKLLEQDDDVLKVLANYITLALFYNPLLEDVLKDAEDETKKLNRKTVLCCFFFQLLGKPLCYLDLTKNEKLTNTYTMQCATSLVNGAIRILEDPFYLLSFVEEKAQNKSHPPPDELDESVNLASPENIYKMEEKLPIESMGIFYYLLIVEEIGFESAPKVYCPVYIFESCLYLVTDFLSRKAPTLQKRGLLLCHKTIDNMGDFKIPDKSLFESIHQNFTRVLAQIIGYSPMKSLRQSAVQLLKKYILRFDDESRCVTIKSLLMSVKHAGLLGYLGTIYKDLVAEKLVAVKNDEDKLPACFSGEEFSEFLLKHICVLPKGVETDLIENSDRIIPALNAIRFFAMTDEKNLTGFWDSKSKIEKEFLDPLRMAINMTVAHYQLEKNTMKMNNGRNEDYERMAEMFSISALNGTDASMAIEPGKHLEILDQGLTSLDLLKCLLAQATECVEKRHKKK